MPSTLLLFAVPALLAAVQEMPMAAPATSCPTTAAPPPASLAAWKPGASLAAATDARSLVSAKLRIGIRSEAMLAPADTVRFRRAPAKASEPSGKAGMFAFTVRKAGTYRVALGNGAWIDLLANGKPLVSSAHAHGPVCSGIHKMVDFVLKPGRHVLQIENSRDAVVAVLITPLS